ncbi:hypothetical protein FOA52_009512 [Chlamydomonas sp. UWO 241]|nr:hypothetical protein FOA52_009512 [Chlamydomonas sp. UWO 241]
MRLTPTVLTSEKSARISHQKHSGKFSGPSSGGHPRSPLSVDQTAAAAEVDTPRVAAALRERAAPRRSYSVDDLGALLHEAPDVSIGAEGGASRASVVDQLLCNEWARGYCTLLAESSSVQGNSHKHLMKLLVRAAGDTTRVANLISNPLDALTDRMCDEGVKMALNSAGTVASLSSTATVDEDSAAAVTVARAAARAPTTDDGSVESDDTDREIAAVLAARRGGGAASTSSAAAAPGGVGGGSGRRAEVNPLQQKALSLMLSLIMSGAAPAAAAATAGQLQHLSPFLVADETGAPQVELVARTGHGVGQSRQQQGLHAQLESLRAPPLAFGAASPNVSFSQPQQLRLSFARAGGQAALGSGASSGGMSAMGGVGGMAMSTARRLLKADSFGSGSGPDLGKFFEVAMDALRDGNDHNGADGDRAGMAGAAAASLRRSSTASFSALAVGAGSFASGASSFNAGSGRVLAMIEEGTPV